MKEGKLSTPCWRSKYKWKWDSSFHQSVGYHQSSVCQFSETLGKGVSLTQSLESNLTVNTNFKCQLLIDPVILYLLIYLDGNVYKIHNEVCAKLFTAKKKKKWWQFNAHQQRNKVIVNLYYRLLYGH